MGLFLYAFLFPGGKEGTCRAALERQAQDPELSIRPEECSWHVYPKGPAVQLNDGAMGFESAGRMSGTSDGTGLDCPVMGLYIYDGDFWGYELWHKGKELDQFASLPDYFDQGEPPDKPGNAELVARLFGVEPERIVRYLTPWREEAVDEYAYEGDVNAIGDCWQMADFLDALGFDYDRLCPPPPEPEKEPNQPAPPPETGWQFLPPGAYLEDTPDLPSALTSRDYALQRLEALGEAYADLLPLMECGKYREAIDRLDGAVQATPEEAGLYLLRAFCWQQLEKASGRSRKYEMERDLGKALELEPENVIVLRARCPTTATSARYSRHIQDLTLLMGLDPENRDIYQISRAYRYHWTKDDDAARSDLEEVLRRGETKTVDLVYLCKELGLPGF